MRIGIFNKWGVKALLVALMSLVVSCATPDEVVLDDGYGYAQFKLYKKASYNTEDTKAIVSQLEWLAEAF